MKTVIYDPALYQLAPKVPTEVMCNYNPKVLNPKIAKAIYEGMLFAYAKSTPIQPNWDGLTDDVIARKVIDLVAAKPAKFPFACDFVPTDELEALAIALVRTLLVAQPAELPMMTLDSTPIDEDAARRRPKPGTEVPL